MTVYIIKNGKKEFLCSRIQQIQNRIFYFDGGGEKYVNSVDAAVVAVVPIAVASKCIIIMKAIDASNRLPCKETKRC